MKSAGQQPTQGGTPPTGQTPQTGTTGLAPNIASLLCYICAPVTSIIFLPHRKRECGCQVSCVAIRDLWIWIHSTDNPA